MLKIDKKVIYVLEGEVVSVTVPPEMDLITITADTNWLELSFDEMVAIYRIFEELIESTNWKK